MTIIAEKGDFSVRKIREDEYRVVMGSVVDPVFSTWVMTKEDVLNLADVLIKAKEIIEKEDNPPCPECGSDNLNVLKEHMSGRLTIHCMSCGKWFDDLELYEKDDVKGKWKEYCSTYNLLHPKEKEEEE